VDHQQYIAAIKATAALDLQVPTVIHVSTGAQETGSMYQGYADRSKGFKEVIEMVMKPPASLETYLHHPAHVEVVKELHIVTEDIFTFDYVAGAGSGTGQ